MMLRRINPRALRIIVTMIACLITFSAAAIVSSADTLPGVEYRVLQSGNGWTKWVRNSETCGDITSGKKIEAIKVILTDTTEADIRYKVYIAGRGWTILESNGGTIGSNEGVLALQISLDGELTKKYSLAYRVHTSGGNWGDWKKSKETAGDISGTTPIDGLEVVLVDANGKKVASKATDYSQPLTNTQTAETVAVQETEVVRGENTGNETESPVTQEATVNVPDNTTPTVDGSQTEGNAAPVVENSQTEGNAAPAVENSQTEGNVAPVVENSQSSNNNQTTEDQSSVWADKLVRIAKEEIGYKQNSDGTTKYGQWWASKVSDNVFASAKWSSMFLAWCGNQAGLSDEQFGYYAASEYWKNWFIANNSYHTRDGYIPKPGDMVFMNNDSDVEADHNGLVIEANSTQVVCVEGNMEGEVKQLTYQLSEATIMGYGTPLFSQASNGTGSTGTNNSTVNPGINNSTANSGNTNNTTTQINNTVNEETSTVNNSPVNNTTTSYERLATPIEGIDVSEFNSINNWSSIASSTNFVYVRLGGRSTAGSIFLDKKFHTNMKGANDAGIDAGVYFFTQAITTQEAIEEANYVIEKCKNYNIKYPIAIDSEKSPSGTRTDSLSKAKRTEIIKTFMDKISAAGYKAQVYSGKCYFYEKFNMNELSGRDIWVAHYYKTYSSSKMTDFKYPFNVWQYSDRGKVNGISGNVDKNVCYVKY